MIKDILQADSPGSNGWIGREESLEAEKQV